MSRLRLVAVAALTLALLAGCGANPPRAGTVEQRTHRDAYTWYQTVHCGKSCIILVPQHEPEAWGLCLAAYASDHSHDAHGCISVTQAIYDGYQVGEDFP